MSRRIRSGLAALAALMIGGLFAVGSAQADTAVTVPLVDVGDEAWVGNAGNAELGANMQAAGDLNGDGITDLLSSQGGTGSTSTSRGVWVLFTQPGSSPSPDLNDLDPTRGYRIRVTNSSLGITGYAPIGDQNGDGMPDFYVRRGNNDLYVVYGVADPATDLPKCDSTGTLATRCLDLSGAANPVADLNGQRQGYMVKSGLTSDSFSFSFAGGDFDGDGNDELALAASQTDVIDTDRGSIYISRHNLGDLCPAMPAPCQLTYSTLPASDVVRIDGPAAATSFGSNMMGAGDLNGDGRDDLLTSVSSTGAEPLSIYAIYGKDWQVSPVGTETFGPTDGFKLAAPGGSINLVSKSVGDVNGDGRNDLAALIGGVLYPNGWKLGVAYSPAAASSDALLLDPISADHGYLVAASATDEVGQGSTPVRALGDLNSDGLGEFVTGLPSATALGVTGAGSARVYLGQQDPPAGELEMGPAFVAERGFSLVGQADLLGVGGGVTDLGDIDDDGIPDLAVASTSGNGRIFIVPGRKLFGNAVTGGSADVLPNGSTLTGTANAHGRSSDAYFEYGETTDYGQETTSQSLGQSNRNNLVEADTTGLDPETTYHYRLVVENGLGLKSFGADRSFTTGAVPEIPKTQCELVPTSRGCEDFCEANPADVACVAPVAGLSDLISSSGAGKVRRGGKVVVRTWITGTGTKEAGNVKVCATVPTKLVKLVGSTCRTIGSVAPGSTAKAQFTVKVKPKARKGAKPVIKLAATADGLPSKSSTVRFTVTK